MKAASDERMLGQTGDAVGSNRVFAGCSEPQDRLYPGETVEGFLLGVGEECIWAEYDDCRCLVTQLSVHDERKIAVLRR